MTALIVFLVLIGLLVAAGIATMRDMRPEQRPRNWSVGSLIEPRR
jgi:hypothetical protein